MSNFIVSSLQRMREKAEELEVHRGAVVICVDALENLFYICMADGHIRFPEPEKRGKDDKGTNYLSFAIGKITQSMRTGLSSCANGAMKGESPARGCVINCEGQAPVYFAFSGGTEEQDVEIANAGKELYDKYLEEFNKYE